MKCRGGLFSGRGDPIWAEYTVFEVVGASDWAWHKGGPSLGQNPEQSRRCSVLANKTWGHLFLGRGYPIGVEYTMFEVVGASNWAWHKGGLVGAKKSKAEPPGLSFGRQNTGGLYFG